MTFGETLRRIRKLRDLPQREVARRATMDFSRFSRIENDRAGFNPTRDTIDRIAEALECTPEERGELLGAAGRLDQEIENAARVASEQPALARLLRVAVQLSPEQLSSLTTMAESMITTHQNKRMKSGVRGRNDSAK